MDYIAGVGKMVAAALLLAACTAPVFDQAGCPALVNYTPEFNARLADEIAPLPDDSAIVTAIGDYIGLRDQVRACRGG